MDTMNLYIKRHIREMKGYRPVNIPSRIKLDANESSYPPPVEIIKAVNEIRLLNRYPDPEAKELRNRLSEIWSVRPDSIIPGNGSDELIYYIITSVGGPVLVPYPTFSMYTIISRILGEKTVEINLDNDFDLPMKDIERAIKRYKPRLIFLSSPNNPTGNTFSYDRILWLIRNSGAIVVVDEAYQPYSKDREGFIPYLRRYRNLFILRTMSKIGFAGIRLGFLIGNPSLVKEINKVRLPYNVNLITQGLGLEILRHMDYIERIVIETVRERERLFRELSEIDGVKPYPSEANFILFRTEKGRMVFRRLIDEGILIKDLSDVIPHCLRVTVGLPEENVLFINAMRRILS